MDYGAAQPVHNIEAGLAEAIAKEIADQKDGNGGDEGFELDAEEDINAMTDDAIRKIATDALDIVNSEEGLSKRLQEFADEYIDQLESANRNLGMYMLLL